MTLRLVEGDRSDDLADEAFFRELELRAELLVARWALAHWQRRVAELERALPPSSPLRGDAPGA